MSGIYLSVNKKSTNEISNIHFADFIKHRGNSERIIFKGPNWISIFYELKIYFVNIDSKNIFKLKFN